MKTLILGTLLQNDGYSKAATEYALSLDSIGVDVVLRHIPMTNHKVEPSDKIKSLLNKDLNDIDVVFQYNLPDQFSYKSGVLNIGGFCYETTKTPLVWQQHLALIDKIVVPCKFQKDTIPKNLLDKTHVIPISTDIDKYSKEYEKMDLSLPKDCFKFYTISEYNKRKNIPALLLSYFSAFTSDDNVVLIIKSHLSNRNPQQSSAILKETINEVKGGINRFTDQSRYPRVILITQFMSDDDINSLHQYADVFVSASHGESWCIPMIDAMGFGNPIIVPNWSAFADHAHKCGLFISGMESTVFGVKDAPKGLYTSDEQWFNINTYDLSQAMQTSYKQQEMWKNDNVKYSNNKYVVDNFSRPVVGQKLVNLIEGSN